MTSQQGNTKYLYWSERMVEGYLQDQRVRQGPTLGGSIDVGVLSISLDPPSVVESRATRADSLSDLRADYIVTDLAYGGPICFAAGRSSIQVGSLRDSGGGDTGALYLFTETSGREGERVAVCLFGSPSNVIGFNPEVPPWRRFGWYSSTTDGVAMLLHTASGAAGSDDPSEVWRAAKVLASEQLERDLCWNALNTCFGQGQYHGNGTAPWRRGYTLGDFPDAEWLAEVYFSSPDVFVDGERFDFVHVGAAFFVRSGSPEPWRAFTKERVVSLDREFGEGDSWRRRRSFWSRKFRALGGGS